MLIVSCLVSHDLHQDYLGGEKSSATSTMWTIQMQVDKVGVEGILLSIRMVSKSKQIQK